MDLLSMHARSSYPVSILRGVCVRVGVREHTNKMETECKCLHRRLHAEGLSYLKHRRRQGLSVSYVIITSAMSKVGQRQGGVTFLQGQIACEELLSVTGTPLGGGVVETHGLLLFFSYFCSCVFTSKWMVEAQRSHRGH